jgi:hypothetical protein
VANNSPSEARGELLRDARFVTVANVVRDAAGDDRADNLARQCLALGDAVVAIESRGQNYAANGTVIADTLRQRKQAAEGKRDPR